MQFELSGDVPCFQKGYHAVQMKVWIPLPDRDFDVTEVAVPWRLLTNAGHAVVFATERGGAAPAADPRLITGVIFGQLGAAEEPKAFYREMEQSPEFRRPIAWNDVEPARYDGLVLPGGHAPGMRQYLGSESLQAKVGAFWELGRPVGAICHGVLVLARTKTAVDGKSVLRRCRTTCLPKYMERTAFLITAWMLGRYYRTYPEYVEDEVKDALDDPSQQFIRGPRVLSRRGTVTDDSPAFVVEDGRYVSARWPGDAYLFAKRFRQQLARSTAATQGAAVG
jgi:putative intracellular protease/amidase